MSAADNDVNMPLEIVWAFVDPRTSLGAALGGVSVPLPHYAENTSGDRRRLKIALTTQTLILGILVTTNESRVLIGSRPTDDQLATALNFACLEFGGTSIDELCAGAASHLQAVCGSDRAVRALRRAIQLVPNAVFCRADLVTRLFATVSAAGNAADAILREVADVFLQWHEQDTSTCRNEEAAFYCGFAALSYFGRTFEMLSTAKRHQDRLLVFPWLAGQVRRLKSVQPGSFSEITLDLGADGSRFEVDS